MASSSTEGAETKMMMPRLALHVQVDVYMSRTTMGHEGNELVIWFDGAPVDPLIWVISL